MSVRMLMLGGVLALLACSAPIKALPASLDPSNPDGPEGIAVPDAGAAPASSSAPKKEEGQGGHMHHHMHAAPESK